MKWSKYMLSNLESGMLPLYHDAHHTCSLKRLNFHQSTGGSETEGYVKTHQSRNGHKTVSITMLISEKNRL